QRRGRCRVLRRPAQRTLELHLCHRLRRSGEHFRPQPASRIRRVQQATLSARRVRTLVIDSATEACSAALFEDMALVARTLEVLGRGHAERLVPMISELPDKGRAERIVVSLGPGSFTGVRIGLAAARALGLAWKAEVLGYPTLALVAAMARRTHPGPVTVCMTGGHGEWFVQDYGPDGLPQGNLVSLAPAE